MNRYNRIYWKTVKEDGNWYVVSTIYVRCSAGKVGSGIKYAERFKTRALAREFMATLKTYPPAEENARNVADALAALAAKLMPAKSDERPLTHPGPVGAQ